MPVPIGRFNLQCEEFILIERGSSRKFCKRQRRHSKNTKDSERDIKKYQDHREKTRDSRTPFLIIRFAFRGNVFQTNFAVRGERDVFLDSSRWSW